MPNTALGGGPCLHAPRRPRGRRLPSVNADTLTVPGGGGAADSITLRLISPTTPDVNGNDFDRASFSRIEIRSGGNDGVRIVDALTEVVTIATGDDADFVQRGGGDDTLLLGNGDDTALQGDGFDQLDGQAGNDTLLAVGNAQSGEFALQANGAKARIALDRRPPTTDSTAVEALDVHRGRRRRPDRPGADHRLLGSSTARANVIDGFVAADVLLALDDVVALATGDRVPVGAAGAATT